MSKMGDRKIELFACSNCPKAFDSRRDYNRHRKTHDRPNKCVICGKVAFALNADLKRHLRDVHDGSRPKLLCPHSECDYRGAKRKDHLLRHLRLAHVLDEVTADDEVIQYRQEHKEASADEAAELRLDMLQAAGEGDEEKLKELISNGGQVNSTSADGLTPLHVASRRGHLSMVNILIESGGQAECLDKDHLTVALCLAAENRHMSVVELLLTRGALVDSAIGSYNKPLFYAATGGDEDIVRLLLDKGANVESKNRYGYTPVYGAAEAGHEGVVRLLLDMGANIESNHGSGDTPLCRAAKAGHEGVVRLLLDMGANVESIWDFRGRTPLYMAAEAGHRGLVRLLLDNGAKTDIKDKWGRSLIDAASKTVADLFRSHTR